MKLSREWLNEFTPVSAPDRDFAEAMTLSGSKVETTEDRGAEISNIVVGTILTMERHPDSDHMWICQLDVGQSAPIQIVTGAWNIHPGDMVPVALDHSTLPGGKKIEKGKLRGVESNGMMCGLYELGLDERDFPYAAIVPAAILNDYHPLDKDKPSIPADIQPGDKVFGPVVCAKILECASQPDYTFHTCLDLGGSTAVPDTICPNLHEGDLVAYNTKTGAICTLEDLHADQKEFPHCIPDGIFVLHEEGIQNGDDIKPIIGADDHVVEFEITPNRPDCLSVIGLAREVAATYQQPLTLHEPEVQGGADGVLTDLLDIETPAADLVPRYTARMVRNVKIAPSPKWMRERLRSMGVRPINNIVDITNYILHAYGQPLHCFDADKIKGGKIVVKTVAEGTTFVTLDEVERKLSDKDLMICNTEEPMCIAGVFGGLDSGTTEQTVDVFLESAYFNPTWVRKTARRHGLSTDSSFRFERGIDPNGTIYALKEAALLVQELAGGTISSEIKDNYPAPIADFTVELNYEKVHSLIGKTIPVETIKSIVTSLEMKIVNETPEGLTLQVPPYRVDVQRDCDVVEDILRIYGYNNVEIPTTLKSSLTTKGEVDYSQKLQNLISEQLVGCGFNEILNNSLTAASYYEGSETYKNENLVYLMNPLSNDLNVMRQTLLFGGLESIQHNANRKNADLKFFEFGNCYFYNAEKKNPEKVLAAYAEEYHLGLWVTGKRVSNSWAHPDENSSVYELKAYVLNIFTRLGLNFGNVVFGNLTNDIYSTAISVHTRGGKLLATFGIISKKIQKAFDIDNEVYYAEINWKELMKAIKSAKVNFKELSKFPAVKRDLALLIDKNIQFAEIEKIAYETEKKLLKEVELFDVYEGKNLEPGKKSYAVSFLLQDESATLNDKQIDKIMSKLIANLENKLGAKLR